MVTEKSTALYEYYVWNNRFLSTHIPWSWWMCFLHFRIASQTRWWNFLNKPMYWTWRCKEKCNYHMCVYAS
jgi:hypothetical protein